MSEHHEGHDHEHHVTLTVVVNGQQTQVAANENTPLGSIKAKALEQTGNSGQPPDNWELRDGQGTLLDESKKIEEFHFPPDVKLFLNLKAGVGGGSLFDCAIRRPDGFPSEVRKRSRTVQRTRKGLPGSWLVSHPG